MATVNSGPGWNSSEGIDDRRVNRIEDLKSIANGGIRPARGGGYIVFVNGPGNAFSGSPSYWHPEPFPTRNAAILQMREWGVKQAFTWELDQEVPSEPTASSKM